VRCQSTSKRCVTGGVGGEVIMWDLERAHPLFSWSQKIDDMTWRLRRNGSGSIDYFSQPTHQLAVARISNRGTASVEPAEGLMAIAVQEGGDGVVLSFGDGRVEWRSGGKTGSHRLAVSGEKLALVDMLAVSNSGRYVAGVTRQPLMVWDTKKPTTPMWLRPLNGFVSSVKFTPDDHHLVAGTLDGEVLHWKIVENSSEPAMRKIANGPVFAIEFSRSQKEVILGSGAGDRNIRVVDLSKLNILRVLPERHAGSIAELELSPDGTMLVSAADDGSIRLWDTETWRDLGSFSVGLDTLVSDLSFDVTGEKLYVLSARSLSEWQVSSDSIQAISCRIANRSLRLEELEQLNQFQWPQRHACASD